MHPDNVDDETRAAPAGQGADVRVGHYRLLQRLGEGGFGTVYLAEQSEPVRRHVALKILKPGMDSRQIVARFEQERQALALMEHPNIARVLDAGTTDDGRPYFAMELVRGEPITEYCDRHSMPVRARLELFVQVCQGVQHAHQKGLIHRDLKPSNVLVVAQDGPPRPKIIDFGIAKATATRLTEHTVFTEQFQLIGTPEYMSPEQAEGSLDIDTRADIYSLGVILYELVSGGTPIPGRDLATTTLLDLVRTIREFQPVTPSRRVATEADGTAVAARRSLDLRRLGALLSGEIDWIVMQAIDKDRTRRYETANGLALDIRRYLSGEPVLAAPPSRSYQVRKFVARHKGPVIAAAGVAAALVLGIAGTVWQGRVAARERDAARREATNARAVTDFVVDSLKSQDVGEQGRQDVTVEAAMRQALVRLSGGALSDQPEVSAVLQRTIAGVLLSNGNPSEAVDVSERAVTLERKVHAGDHEHLAAALVVQADALLATGGFARSEALIREAVAMRRRLGGEPGGLIEAVNELGGILLAQDKTTEAIPFNEEALSLARQAYPAGHRQIAIALNDLALARKRLNQFEEAERLYTQALEEMRRINKGDHVDIAAVLSNLGAVRRQMKRFDDAQTALDEALAMNQRILKGDSPNTAAVLMQMSANLEALKRNADAERRATECAEMLGRLFPKGHPYLARALMARARLQLAQGKVAQAVASATEGVAVARRVYPNGHADTVSALMTLARAEGAARQWPSALDHAREAAAMRAKLTPDEAALRQIADDLVATLARQAAGER